MGGEGEKFKVVLFCFVLKKKKTKKKHNTCDSTEVLTVVKNGYSHPRGHEMQLYLQG